MKRKIAIVDASSAIILCRAGLHLLLAGTYDIILPASVFREITARPYAGSAEYKDLAGAGKVRIEENNVLLTEPGMAVLDKGECDAIHLLNSGRGDFVITDDGPAARYCSKEGIPFINSLLFPVILQMAHIKNNDFCQRATEKIKRNGRYSNEIVDRARKCRGDSIMFAMP